MISIVKVVMQLVFNLLGDSKLNCWLNSGKLQVFKNHSFSIHGT